jgi:hypothetical protein
VTDKISILRDFARQIGKQTKSCNCYDANVCDYSIDRQSSWKPIVHSGQPFLERLRAEYVGHRIHLMANLRGVCFRLKGGFDIGVCSINHPNRIYPVHLTMLKVAGDPRWSVFSSRPGDKKSEGLRLFLERTDVYEAIQRLIVGESDSLHFFEGAVTLYSSPNSTEELRSALDCLASLAALFPPPLAVWNLHSLPNSLFGLTGLIQKWAIGDDSERADLLEESPTSELSDLVTAVDAHFEEISRYRSSVEDSDEVAIALGTLEECAEEARLMLKPKMT